MIAVARFFFWETRFVGPHSLRYVWGDAPMAGDEIDQEAARLTAASAALKIEHARLSATAHTARELEAHVAALRAHVQCLRACIEQMR